MGLELSLAWRNVWRNPRRTGLTVAATVFAVYLVVVFVAMGAGTHSKMIEDSVRVHSGHLSVSGEGYLEKRTLEQYIELDAELVALLDREPAVEGWAPRVMSFALVSRDERSQGVAVLGVDPERESTVTTLSERVVDGRFLELDGSREIVLGQRLADQLGARLGDEILVYGIAYSLETSYELFRVVGLMRLPEPNLERRLAVISLGDAQDFYVYGDRVSEVAILAADADASGFARDALWNGLEAIGAERAEIHTWDEVMPDLEQLIFLDDAGMYMMLSILVVVVGFGILNTILMAVLERTRELGVMLAVGLRPAAIFRVVYLESMMLACVGLTLGLALALPTVLYFVDNPIPITGEEFAAMTEYFGMEPVITFKFKPTNPFFSSLTILGVGLVAAFYPALKASRARPVDALRSV